MAPEEAGERGCGNLPSSFSWQLMMAAMTGYPTNPQRRVYPAGSRPQDCEAMLRAISGN